MYLNVEGHTIKAAMGQTLLDMIQMQNLDESSLSRRPLAAKIAGEVFTLKYIPVREKEFDPDRPSIRRAMAASGGDIHLLRYGDASGKDVYIRTAQFVIFLAIRRLWPQAVAKMNCTLGDSVFISVTQAPDFSAAA